MWGKKVNANKEYGFGLTFGNNLGRESIVPVFLYNKNFSPKVGVELLLPKRAFLRYNFSSKTILYAGTEIDGARYYIPKLGIAPGVAESFELNYSEIRSGIKWKQEIFPVLWIQCGVGYRAPVGRNLLQPFQASNAVIQSDIKGGVYAQVRVAVTLPKNLLK